MSPKFFRPKFFRGRPRGMSVPKCLFFQDLEGLTEVFGRMSAGTSGRKLPLWADFSFLKERLTRCSRGSTEAAGRREDVCGEGGQNHVFRADILTKLHVRLRPIVNKS